MRFAREGYPFMLAGSILAALAWAAVPVWNAWIAAPAGVLTALVCFIFYFFRDPERLVPAGEGAVIAPGDGKIIDIREVDEPTFFEGRCRRITIFLSVFNVHVQRAPISGSVAHRDYRPGKYAVAWHPKASETNEQSSLGLSTQWGRVLVRQIAGLIARRIVTYPELGDEVHRGDRIGLIRFGSRVDLFIPLDWPLACAVGDKAVGGTTVFANVMERARTQDQAGAQEQACTQGPAGTRDQAGTQEASA